MQSSPMAERAKGAQPQKGTEGETQSQVDVQSPFLLLGVWSGANGPLDGSGAACSARGGGGGGI